VCVRSDRIEVMAWLFWAPGAAARMALRDAEASEKLRATMAKYFHFIFALGGFSRCVEVRKLGGRFAIKGGP
jgi:hypothetical protein